MKSKLSRRDFTASLLAAVALPRLTLAQNNREYIRFGVFSLFEPQQLLLESAQPLLLHLDRSLLLIRPEAPAISIRTAPSKRFEVILNGTTHDSTALSVTSIGGEATTFTLAVPPPSLHGTISRQYAATLELQIHPTSHALQPVITMDRESAVASIVLAESPSHAPLAYLQAQAIVSRSFLLAGVSGHSGFDFCDTTHCQFLREAPPPDSLVTRAALQTRSLHLTYEGQSFPAMYSRSCGGHTHTLADLGLPAAIYPYYSVVCDVCLQHPERWQRTLDSLREPPQTERARLALDRIHGWSALPSGTFERTSAGMLTSKYPARDCGPTGTRDAGRGTSGLRLRLVLDVEAQCQMFTPHAIGFVDSPYKDTAAIPKGLGAKHDAEGVLCILPEFELGLTDIEGFSHLMVIWAFDRSHGFDLLGTPPFDNRPHGVFATRSPRRPNPIGLTVVELLRRENGLLHVRGVDMLDGTPILDIKPYLSSVPSETLRRGWLAEAESRNI